MKFFFLFFLILSPPLCAWVNPENFSSSLVELEEKIISQSIRGRIKDAESSVPLQTVDNILLDKENKVDPRFKVNTYFRNRVKFWFSVYTQYSSHQVIIHDKKNLDLVYSVVDFTNIHDSKINKYAKAHLQNRLTTEHVKKIKTVLNSLSKKDTSKLSPSDQSVIQALKLAGFKIPKNFKKKKVFFSRLAKNLRTQTGQRNKIFQGVLRSLPYLPFLEKKIHELKLPKELLAISFLESSFNIKAKSKVDAVGIWQFMRYTSNLTMPKITKNIDYRRSPIISSLAAMQLLKENRLILRRWDLAITAYNSGTRNLINARKKFKGTKPLPYILENYKHSSLGFASKNFYAEFLALVHTLAYKEVIYPLNGHQKLKELIARDGGIDIYLSKCKLTPSKLFKVLKKFSPKINELNSHILRPHRTYPKGLIVVSDRSLSRKRYLKLTTKQVNKSFPKSFLKYLKAQKCGKL